MRAVFLVSLAMVSVSAFSINSAQLDNPTEAHLVAPGYMTSLELSHDNGNITGAYDFPDAGGYYVAVQYALPSGGPWYLNGIKYNVWEGPPSWPDSIYQGFGVGCWKMAEGIPGNLVWPADGELIYNPNTGGNWIIQSVEPNLNLTQSSPSGFFVGVDILYSHPNCDGIGYDFTGPSSNDWWHNPSLGWIASSFGKNAIRAFVNDIGNPGVETTTIGQIRALYR